jgi:hypothetical protein
MGELHQRGSDQHRHIYPPALVAMSASVCAIFKERGRTHASAKRCLSCSFMICGE